MHQFTIKPRKVISTAWSPELAYAVGLLATDGCLSSDGRHIDFTSQDTALVETFKKCLGITEIKTGMKVSGQSGKLCPRVQFGNVIFYRWLQRLGLTTRKSKTLAKLNIPDKYFFDFLRGCFDGDGTIFSYWDKRWKNSFMFYVAFISGSREFITWLQVRISKYLGINGHIISGGRNTYQLRYAKKDSIALIQAMFYSSKVPFLKRKYAKLQKILEENSNSRAGGETGRHATLRG